MNLRFAFIGVAALLTALVQAPLALSDVGGLPQPSSTPAYGPSPYYMPDMSRGPAPTPMFGDLPPIYYTSGSASVSGPAPATYGVSPYYMPDLTRAPRTTQLAIGSSPYYMPDLSRPPMGAPVRLAATQQPAAAPPETDAGDDVEIAEIDLNDPLEPINRFFFGFNNYLEQYLVSPIITVYNWLPVDVRGSVSNFLRNLNSPIVLANDLLQFEFLRAWETTERLVINTTLGVGGLFDVAKNEYFDIPKHNEDFGQTLGTWGVGEMFYLVLPIFGPSSPRDAVGKLFVDNYFDPVGYWLKGKRNDALIGTNSDALVLARSAVGSVDKYASVKSELDIIRNTSIDFYATIRSMYRQKRERDIANGDVVIPTIPDYDLDNIEIE